MHNRDMFLIAVKKMPDAEVKRRIQNEEMVQNSAHRTRAFIEEILADPEAARRKIEDCNEQFDLCVERITIFNMKLMGLLK